MRWDFATRLFFRGKAYIMKVSATITIHVAPADLAVSDQALPDAKVGQDISGDAIKISGGTPPYSVSKVSGTVPPGTTLMDDGTLQGAPTLPGDYSFAVEVADAQG